MARRDSTQPFRSDDLSGIVDAVVAVARGQGLSQQDLARRAGVHVEDIAKNRSRKRLDQAQLASLAQAAGFDLRLLALPKAPLNGPSTLSDPALQLAWSNRNAPAKTLVAKAIERRSFHLILKAVREHGLDAVASVLEEMRAAGELSSGACQDADRALRNIAVGASRALHAAGH